MIFSEARMRDLLFRSFAVVVIPTATIFTPLATDASTNYGIYAGSTVIYRDVTESSGTDPLPLFGAPTLIGNTLDFNPTFVSFASNGSSDQTDGQLNFLLEAKPGNAIPSIVFTERGDFTFTGSITTGTRASVSATFFIDVYAVDGVDLPAPLPFGGLMSFSPDINGNFPQTTYPNPPDTKLWSGAFNFDVNTALNNAGVNYASGATKVSVVLDNILTTDSEPGTSARIAKKDFKGVGITVPVVPEPSTFTLLLAGAGLWALRSRRVG
jgi:hypothetical protein